MTTMQLTATERARDSRRDNPERDRSVGIPVYWTNRLAPTPLLDAIHQREMQALQLAYPSIQALERTNFQWIAAFAESTTYVPAKSHADAGLVEQVVNAAIAHGQRTFCYACENGATIYIIAPFSGSMAAGEHFKVLWGRCIDGQFGSWYEYDVVVRGRQLLIDVDVDAEGTPGPLAVMLIAGPELGSDPVWGRPTR